MQAQRQHGGVYSHQAPSQPSPAQASPALSSSVTLAPSRPPVSDDGLSDAEKRQLQAQEERLRRHHMQVLTREEQLHQQAQQLTEREKGMTGKQQQLAQHQSSLRDQVPSSHAARASLACLLHPLGAMLFAHPMRAHAVGVLALTRGVWTGGATG